MTCNHLIAKEKKLCASEIHKSKWKTCAPHFNSKRLDAHLFYRYTDGPKLYWFTGLLKTEIEHLHARTMHAMEHESSSNNDTNNN